MEYKMNDKIDLSEIKQYIMNMWKEILCQDKIDTEESIFVLGGDSISIMKAMNEIQNYYQITLEVTDVFENDTINKLSEYVMQLLQNKGGHKYVEQK